MAESKGVLLKGLPFSISKDEIKHFFRSLVVPNESIHIVRYRDGQGTGLGFVLLQDKEEIDLALLMDRNHIGARYVEVVESSMAQLHMLERSAEAGYSPSELYKLSSEKKGKGATQRDRSPVRSKGKLTTRFVYIQGIPGDHNYKEVRKFFSGCLIGKNCVHLVRGPNGDFRGDGYVEFATEQDAERALEKDGGMMNGYPIRVEPCSGKEVLRMLPQTERTSRTPSPVRRRQEAYAATYGRESLYRDVYIDSLGDRYHPDWDERITRYEAMFMSPPPPPRRLDPLHLPLPAAGVPVDLVRLPPSSSESLYHRHSHHDPFPMELPRPEPYQRITQSRDGYHTASYAHQQDSYRGGDRIHLDSQPSARAPPFRHEEPISSTMRYGGPGPVPSAPVPLMEEHRLIRLEGLPYNVSIYDIVSFFQGFGVEYDNVRLQCRDDGSPSGKAFVALPSERLAQAAVHQLNRRHILGRYVELFLV